ncbi:MAG: ribonuclease HI [Rickettsiaceae bacterium]|nr:ribonuclease HI [Rickettsiaceae bacterium]
MSLVPRVLIYTDGACAGNPGPGGWGALLVFNDKKKEIFGYELNTTNNQMEIQGAIKSLRELKKSCKVDLYTDSKYLQQGITIWINNWKANNWKKSDNKPVKNLELWQDLDKELKKHDITWHWVKGHGNNEGNILADKLAVQGKEEAMKLAKKQCL